MLMDRISGTSPNFMPHLLWLANLHDLILVNVMSAIKKVARYHKQKLFHDPTFVIKLLLRRKKHSKNQTKGITNRLI